MVIARDSYTLLHLPMVAGIVLLAAGIKAAVAHVGDPLDRARDRAVRRRRALPRRARALPPAQRPLAQPPADRGRDRAPALIPVATRVSGLAALALVAAVLVGLIAYEALRFREARARVRAGGGSMRFSPPS